ncbi:MAG: class I SAM-dependent methyltransferase, partial [Nanoarchaeota archaeon]
MNIKKPKTNFFDLVGDRIYDNHTAAFQDYFRREAEALAPILARGGRILDVGCGPGRIFPVVAPYVDELLGIDNSAESVKNAKKVAKKYGSTSTNGLHVLLEDARDMRASPDIFDAAFLLYNTLGNFRDSKADYKMAVLENIRRMLKPSGILAISVYAENAAPFQIEQYCVWDLLPSTVLPEYTTVVSLG